MKVKDRIKNVIIISLILLFSYCNVTLADVGSFESYDSGGSSWSSGSSDWGSSSSDWGSSSSDWDSDEDFSFGVLYSFFMGGTPLVIIFIIIYYIYKSKKHGPDYNFRDYNKQPPENYEMIERQVENKIKATDPMFNKEEFLAFARNVFVKLQEAWTARDWETIRTFETNELFEQHKNQLQGYIDNNQINVMERICVKSAYLYSFAQSGDKEILNVTLNSKMIDYIIDATTKKVLKGDKVTDRHSTYRLTFIRKAGVKTKEGSIEVNTTNCPNCGAPTQITSAGKCEYCGSVITTGEYNWVLSNLTKVQ